MENEPNASADGSVIDMPRDASIVEGDDQIRIPFLDMRRNKVLDQLLIPPFPGVILQRGIVQDDAAIWNDPQHGAAVVDFLLATLAYSLIISRGYHQQSPLHVRIIAAVGNARAEEESFVVRVGGYEEDTPGRLERHGHQPWVICQEICEQDIET